MPIKAVFLRSPSVAFCVKHEGGVLLHRHRFAGQGGLFDAQVDGLDQAHVGRDEVAGFQEDDIARHQLGAGTEMRRPSRST